MGPPLGSTVPLLQLRGGGGQPRSRVLGLTRRRYHFRRRGEEAAAVHPRAGVGGFPRPVCQRGGGPASCPPPPGAIPYLRAARAVASGGTHAAGAAISPAGREHWEKPKPHDPAPAPSWGPPTGPPGPQFRRALLGQRGGRHEGAHKPPCCC